VSQRGKFITAQPTMRTIYKKFTKEGLVGLVGLVGLQNWFYPQDLWRLNVQKQGAIRRCIENNFDNPKLFSIAKFQNVHV
jgi:hypothetical protein